MLAREIFVVVIGNVFFWGLENNEEGRGEGVWTSILWTHIR